MPAMHLLLNPRNRLSQGCCVHAISRLATIILGDFAIGSILDPVGTTIFHSGPITQQYPWLVQSPAPGIIDRQSVSEALQSGVISIDSIKLLVIVQFIGHIKIWSAGINCWRPPDR
jgi:F-type H+/Na+-transporting ATPase subunit alpha